MTSKLARKKTATKASVSKSQKKTGGSAAKQQAAKNAPNQAKKSIAAKNQLPGKQLVKQNVKTATRRGGRARASTDKPAAASQTAQQFGEVGGESDNSFNFDHFASIGVEGDKFATSFKKLLEGIAGSPDVVADTVKDHAEEQNRLVAEFVAAMKEKKNRDSGEQDDAARAQILKDPRFCNPLWQSHPIYRYLIGSYLASGRILRETTGKVELDKKDRKAVDFIIEQMISAMSPSNFALTNPEVVEATLQSGGENLRTGMLNYLDDAEKGIVANTDPEAFAVGRNLALTPGKVVFQNHIFQLIEYAPVTKKVAQIPLLIVPPCINKYYILDLQPENSFIAHLLSRGIRVFLVSWVNAGERHANLGWDDFVAAGVIESLETACEIAGQPQVHTLGYCIGGTLLACALSVLADHGGQKAASISLLCSFLDFSDTGDIGLFVHEDMVRKNEEKFVSGGLFPGRDLARMFAYLRPNDLVWPYVVNNYLLGKKPKPFDILHWNSDSTNMPGPMYAWYLRHTYLENILSSGNVEVCGSKVKFERIGLPGVAVSCLRDHIVPWRSAYSSALLLGPQTKFILASSGHVAGIVNPPSRQKGYFLSSKSENGLVGGADEWLADAEKTDGGWWNWYADWLFAKSGPQVSAPAVAGSLRHRPVEDAPGSYVCDPLPRIA